MPTPAPVEVRRETVVLPTCEPRHKATVVNIRGDSYRLRERRQAGATDSLLTNPQPKA